MGIFSSEIDTLIGSSSFWTLIHLPTLVLVEATSEYLPAAQADLAKNLEICDLIKSRQASPKEAMRSLKRRLEHRNPNVQLLALELTDAAVKNTSPVFLRELVSREFISVLTSMVGGSGGESVSLVGGPVAAKTRELFQMWALLLGVQPGLGYIREAYEQCRREGIPFPAAPPGHALTSNIVRTEAPPEWTDSATCERCADVFGVLLRKHHCRRCGRTFCQDCSSKMMALPEMGLYEEVRVCEGCYALKFAERTGIGEKPLPVPDEAEDEAEDDLSKAIRLSLQESQSRVVPGSSQTAAPKNAENYDEEAALAAAIAASLQDAAAVGTRSEAPATIAATTPAAETDNMSVPQSQPQPTLLLVSPIERENVQLFSELISRMSSQDEELEEADFLKLARDMMALRNRLLEGISLSSPTADIQRLLHTLETALAQYERLALTVGEHEERVESDDRVDSAPEEDNRHQHQPTYDLHPPVHGQPTYNPYRVHDLTTIPSRPRSHTGSIMVRMPTRTHQPQSDDNGSSLGGEEYKEMPPYMRPVPAEIAPALQPRRTNSARRTGSTNDADNIKSTMTMPPTGVTDSDMPVKEAILIPLSSDYEEGNTGDADKEREDPLAELTDVLLIQL